MSNVNYDVELLNSVVSSGSVSYESVGNQQSYACDDCYGGCAGTCQGECLDSCRFSNTWDLNHPS
ncbi:hypothetical protein J6Z19_03365 [bacterium]|nr:hypothetical protein [bacterium]